MMDRTEVADRALAHAVEAELLWEPRLSSTGLVVVAHDGAVTLQGTVESLAERHAALTAAWRIRGVRALNDTIRIEIHRHHKRSDDEIAALAAHRFAGNLQIPQNAIRIAVRNGWITLTGQVGKGFQSQAAEHDLQGLPGIVGIRNEIVIKTKLPLSDLGDSIGAAIARSRLYDPDAIQVSAQGSVVVLKGRAASPHDRQIALDTAWAIPGITGIEDDIVLG